MRHRFPVRRSDFKAPGREQLNRSFYIKNSLVGNLFCCIFRFKAGTDVTLRNKHAGMVVGWIGTFQRVSY